MGWILVDDIHWLASVNLKFTSIQCADNVGWAADLLKNYLDYFCRFSVIAETEEELIKRLNEWKENVESKGMRVNMNKTKVMISEERQMV